MWKAIGWWIWSYYEPVGFIHPLQQVMRVEASPNTHK